MFSWYSTVMFADVRCQVDFYYDAKITRVVSLFETSIDGQSHRICRYVKSIFVAGQARGKSSS